MTQKLISVLQTEPQLPEEEFCAPASLYISRGQKQSGVTCLPLNFLHFFPSALKAAMNQRLGIWQPFYDFL